MGYSQNNVSELEKVVKLCHIQKNESELEKWGTVRKTCYSQNKILRVTQKTGSQLQKCVFVEMVVKARKMCHSQKTLSQLEKWVRVTQKNLQLHLCSFVQYFLRSFKLSHVNVKNILKKGHQTCLTVSKLYASCYVLILQVYLFERVSYRRTPAKEGILIERFLSLFEECLIKDFKKTLLFKQGL